MRPHNIPLPLAGLQVLSDPDDGLQEALGRLHRQHESRPPQGWHEGTHKNIFDPKNHLNITFIIF